MSTKLSIARRIALGAAALAIVAASATSAAAADRRIVVINSTNHTMTRLYASNTSDPRYHDDLLGEYVMRPGGSTTMDFDDNTGACWFDIKAVFSDGDEVQQRNFNVCRETSLKFTGN